MLASLAIGSALAGCDEGVTPGAADAGKAAAAGPSPTPGRKSIPAAATTPTRQAAMTPSPAATAEATRTPASQSTPAPTATAEATRTPTPSPTAPPAAERSLFVSAFQCDAPGNDNENPNGEFFSLRNDGASLNLRGWRATDAQDREYEFPDYELDNGATVTIHSGTGADGQGKLYWGARRAIWNNDGDRLTVLDAEGQVVVTADCP